MDEPILTPLSAETAEPEDDAPVIHIGMATVDDPDVKADMDKFLSGVIGVVDATHFEMHCIWRECHEDQKMPWESRSDGRFIGVGFCAEMPVTLSLWTSMVNGNAILFVDSPSQVVDHRLIDKWLAENMPASARDDDGHVIRTDATNFHNILPR